MFDWWHRVCDSTEKFKWWHPKRHTQGDWDLPFNRLQYPERQPGYYIDHALTVDLILDKKRHFSIDYDRPSKHFGHIASSSTNICARLHTNSSLVGWIGFGYVIYVLRKVGNTNQLHVRYRLSL